MHRAGAGSTAIPGLESFRGAGPAFSPNLPASALPGKANNLKPRGIQLTEA